MTNNYNVDKLADVFLQELKDEYYECYSTLKERNHYLWCWWIWKNDGYGTCRYRYER